MKKLLLLLSAALTALAVSACGASAPAAQPAPQNTAAADGHKAVLVIDGSRLPVTLRNEPSANDLYSRLPVTLSFKDFSGMEKIDRAKGWLPSPCGRFVRLSAVGQFKHFLC